MEFKILRLSILCLFMFITPVFAENKVDYTLTLTDDYKFNEVIKYEISDYKQIQNGYNPFADIVEDDITVDIMDKTTYKKTKTFSNGKYYVTLKYTHSEYSLSNSIFLNDCFENEKYKYDMNSYSFNGSGDFYCLRGDSLKITFITNFDVTSTNAQKIGNKYIWNPVDNKFTMNININKKYDVSKVDENEATDYVSDEDIYENNNGQNNDDNNEQNENNDETNTNSDQDNEKENNFLSIGSIIFVIIMSAVGLITYKILKNKKESLNKI